jgi:thiamine kinase-like enzyme
MLETRLPTDPKDLTVELLNELINAQMPGVTLTAFAITESHVWGGGHASSAGRIVIEPTYESTSPTTLPRHIVIKVAKTAPGQPGTPNPTAGAGGALYFNEVNIYKRLKPSTFLEAPAVLGGAYDPSTNSLTLLMEDLRDRGVRFASVTVPTSLDRMRSLLDQLAILHGRYWNSPELESTLGWMQWHTKGKIFDQFNTPEIAPRFIAHQVETEQFKQEMVQRLGTTVDGLFRRFQTVQKHQARLAQTVCHGDTHIGNTYILPDDTAGLLDWQLTSKGYALHDVSYIVATALSVADRRAHERELLAYYREQLLARGVKDAPSLDTLWLEYRRAMVWGVYIGWLTTPVVNYGWEITVIAHLRMMTAYEDLETSKTIDALG